ncbi:MAG: hypothetical protein R3D98_17250 [Candidatus Krumholzibacteriia bacterium]
MRHLALTCLATLLAATATAGGLGLPTSHHGLGLGNLTEFSGIRLNLQDRGVREVNGLNVTLWLPRNHAGGRYQGVGVHLIGASGDSFRGVYVSGLATAVVDEGQGVFVSGLGFGGGDLAGLVIAGLGAGMSDLSGVAVAGLGLGAERVQGILLAGLGAGVEDIDGIALALLGFGAEDATGVMLAGLGIGGQNLRGVFAGGLGVGAETLAGVAVGGGVRSAMTQGLALAAVYQRTELLYGVSTGLYNRADEAHGLMLGVVNHAEVLRGVQIGLLNHVGSGPAAARWLPLINARF